MTWSPVRKTARTTPASTLKGRASRMTDPLDPMVASAKIGGPGMCLDQDSVRLGLYFGDSTGRFGTELRLRVYFSCAPAGPSSDRRVYAAVGCGASTRHRTTFPAVTLGRSSKVRN